MKQQKALTLKTLTKSNVWEVQENDILRMWESAEKDADFKDNRRHFLDIIRSAFEIEEMNIHHISAAKLIEVLDRNFGGGWDSLSQSIQDIIESGFDISTTTLPKDRLHKVGGMYEKKVNDGFEVLEIPKGAWVEAIFAKEKPEMEKPVVEDDDDNLSNKYDINNDDEDEDEDLPDDKYEDEDEDDDTFDEDKLTEESYRTTFETDPDDLNLEAEDVTDDDDNY